LKNFQNLEWNVFQFQKIGSKVSFIL
jgi:hypothetical protein